MSRFSKLHPIFHFLFFIGMFLLTVSVYNPIFSAVSLLCGILYELKIRGREGLSSLKFSLAILVVVSIFNMLFAHYGVDVLFTIKDTEFTLEALFYGFNQGLMVAGMIIWFSLFGRVVDSEKVIYVFRFTPKLALLFSMVLGFIPRFTKKLKDIEEANLGLNGGKAPKNRLKQGITNLSALISYSLESSIITADSMSARGYNPKAVKPSRYKIKPVDIVLALLVIAIIIYVFYAKIEDKITFIFDPMIYMKSFDLVAIVLFSVLCLLPLAVDLVEELLWKISYSKM